VRPGIHNDVGPNGFDRCGQTRQVGEITAKIEAVKIQRNTSPKRAKLR
jgi:hypothetical protein